MIHILNLNPRPFYFVSHGLKDIEMRMYDERRKKIKPNDFIIFKETEKSELVIARVINLHIFDSFDELYAVFEQTRLGYYVNEEAKPSDMLEYYSKEIQSKNKVVGIEIQVFNQVLLSNHEDYYQIKSIDINIGNISLSNVYDEKGIELSFNDFERLYIDGKMQK